MVAEKTQQAFEAIADGLLGGTQAQTDALEASNAEKEKDLQNEEKANAIDHLSKAGQNITDEKPQNIQIDKDRGHGM